MGIRLGIASDHGGYELKESLKQALESGEANIVDLGVHSPQSTDYPDQAHGLAEAVLGGNVDLLFDNLTI